MSKVNTEERVWFLSPIWWDTALEKTETDKYLRKI